MANDTIYCGPGTNQIDGGPGTDTAVFAGNYADYDMDVRQWRDDRSSAPRALCDPITNPVLK